MHMGEVEKEREQMEDLLAMNAVTAPFDDLPAKLHNVIIFVLVVVVH